MTRTRQRLISHLRLMIIFAQCVKEYGNKVVRAVGRPADFMEELYFVPGADASLASRDYFGEEPEFEEDL